MVFFAYKMTNMRIKSNTFKLFSDKIRYGFMTICPSTPERYFFVMGVLFPFFIVLLCFILKTSEISGEKCDTVKYKIPETIFRTNNETTRMCKSNSDKVSHSVINDNFGEISLNVTLNTSLSVGEYIFELYWNCDNFFHTKQRFVVCSDKCNASVYTPCANVSFLIPYQCKSHNSSA